MNNKRVFLFTSCYPYFPGEEFIHNEIEYLSSHFEEVIILPFNKLNKERSIPFENVKVDLYFALKGINVSTILKNLVNPIPFLFPLELNYRYLKNIVIYYLNSCLIKSYFKQLSLTDHELKNSICYTYWFDEKTIGLAYSKSKFGYKLITRAHRWDLYEYLYGFNFFPMRKWAIPKIDILFPSTFNAKQHLENKYAIEKNRIVLNRYGIYNNENLSPKESNSVFVLVSCSLIKQVKRIELIIEALAVLSKKNRGPVLWVHIGDGELEKTISELATEKLERTNVDFKFLGNLPNEEVYLFYENNHVDLFINVSSSEGSPVSIMEANSYGIPAMASDVGGTKEIVNEKTGYLLNANPTPEEIAAEINFLINNRATLTQKAIACKEYINKHFDREKNYLNFCQKILEL